MERQYRSKANGDFYIINVVFITRRPADSLVDKVLRECITASLVLDEKKNIMANAWFIPILGPDAEDVEDVEKLDPYGPLKYIAYTASTKSVGIRSVQLPKK